MSAVNLLLLTLSGGLTGSDLTIRSTTRLVDFTVIAQDAQGRPIINLKKEDFKLFDGHKARPIQFFTLNDQTQKMSAAVKERKKERNSSARVLKAVVRDGNSGNIGSLTIPLR